MSSPGAAASGRRPWSRRLPSPDEPLFVYGTLRFDPILNALLGRVPALQPARLLGRRIAALPDRVYPGLVAAADGVAAGFLLTGLTESDWRVLDAFEDQEYDLRPVPAHAGDRELYAWTYVWTDPVLGTEWSAEEFAAEHLPSYLAQCAEWRRNTLFSETV